MNRAANTEVGAIGSSEQALVSFDQVTETLNVDGFELRFDWALGDEELEASLLEESLETQYCNLLRDDSADDERLQLQSTLEWVMDNGTGIAGVFKFLKTLKDDLVSCENSATRMNNNQQGAKS